MTLSSAEADPAGGNVLSAALRSQSDGRRLTTRKPLGDTRNGPHLRVATLMAHFYARYGDHGAIEPSSAEAVFARLLHELRNEPADGRDVEHTQVSVSNGHWAVTAEVGGLVTFDNIDILESEPSDLPEWMCLQNPDDS